MRFHPLVTAPFPTARAEVLFDTAIALLLLVNWTLKSALKSLPTRIPWQRPSHSRLYGISSREAPRQPPKRDVVLANDGEAVASVPIVGIAHPRM